ncbi:hypothetical protein ACFL6G_05850 [candidate division KSB1 bacterium]
MNNNFLIAILFISILSISCSSPTDNDTLSFLNEPFNVPVKDIVAFSARFEDNAGNLQWRLVLIDIHDRSHYKILNCDTVSVYGKKFSPGKDKILFNGEGSISIYDAYPQFFIYDVRENTILPLQRKDNGGYIDPINGAYPVWFNDESGFYFWSLGSSSTYYYKFPENNSFLLDMKDLHARVIGIMEDNSIIAYNRDSGCHLFDDSGNYIRILGSEHINDFSKNGIDFGEYGEYLNIDWHQGAELFVYSGSKITVADMDSNVLREFEGTVNSDYCPVFGPDAENILFLRGSTGVIMHIDVETGTVSDFLCPDDIGAVRIMSVDY